MKVFKTFGLALVLSVCLLTWLDNSDVEASQYFGEFCLQNNVGEILQVGLTDMGGGHYLFNGRLIETDPHIITTVHGNAEIISDKVYFTSTSSGSNANDTWTFIGNGILNLPGLSGTIEIMGVSHSKTNPNPDNASLDYDGPFTLNRIQCP
jgi:hypothetical protein